tara:strand:- start:611 stop:2581 length:1971 start_codon:yes stop_codon:yes gene_type:complete
MLDGTRDSRLGVNTELSTMLLPEGSLARATNVSVRKGQPRTRPAFVAETLTLPDTFQGGGVWSLESGDRFVLVSEGIVYVIDLDTLVITNLGLRLDPSAQCFGTQAHKYFLISDGVTTPAVIEDIAGVPTIIPIGVVNWVATSGTSADATEDWITKVGHGLPAGAAVTFTTLTGGTGLSLATVYYVRDVTEDTFRVSSVPSGTEVDITVDYTVANYTATFTYITIPVGYMSTFAHGRIHIVPKVVPLTTEDGRATLVSGDIQLPKDPKTVLIASETEYLNEGGAHGMPYEMGFIKGLGTLRNAASGTGNGETLVFARRGIMSFDFSLDRDTQWKTQGLARILFQGPGSLSPWSVINVNDDLVYRGLDGIRTVRYTASQGGGASGALSNVPLTTGVQEYFTELESDMAYISQSFNDNRLLTTVGGTGNQTFRGLTSLDSAARHYTGVSGPGAFDGLWTGDNFVYTFTAQRGRVDTSYALAEGLTLYRIDTDSNTDIDSGGASPIESRIHTKALAFQDPYTVKALKYVDIWASDIRIDTTFTVYYRPYGYALWSTLGSSTVQVGTGSLPQTRRRVHITLDETGQNCDPVSQIPLSVGTTFELAIEWTGFAQVDSTYAVAERRSESPVPACSETEDVVLVAGGTAGESLSDYSYEIEGT